MRRVSLSMTDFQNLCLGGIVRDVSGEVEIALNDIGFDVMRECVERAHGVAEFGEPVPAKPITVYAVAEILYDDQMKVLSVERYALNRRHKVGETFIRDSKKYQVIASDHTEGKHGGSLVEHIVREIS